MLKSGLFVAWTAALAAAVAAFPLQLTTSVNVSDAWLLPDGESPFFYRHFRDKVTWAEAESVCQFHHSVLATVRNTAEFDRTRALLRQLEWSTPAWVGLRRASGQPMFKWSTPAGATLEASEGYWHEAPNAVTSAPQCVAIDPAADFRWRAVDCASQVQIHSFLCQIPVPSWVRSEQGGCLSPKWPNKEVTVQFIPQTRALEMTADCGLRGTRRIACKHNSEKDLHLMEQKLRCSPEEEDSAQARSPITRHRRDVESILSTSTPAPSTSLPSVDLKTTSELPRTTSEKSEPSSTTEETILQTTATSEIQTTSEIPSTTMEPTTMRATSPVEATSSSATEASTRPEVEQAKTEPLTPESTTGISQLSTTPETSKMNVEIIAHIFDTSTDGTAINTIFTVEQIQMDDTKTTKPDGQPEEIDAGQLASSQGIVVAKHQRVVIDGTPRNVPSVEHDHHPPMVIPSPHHPHHNVSPGMPRIVAPPLPAHPFLHHPMVHVNGHPRLEETRSAEDHVALRRKQFLPTPLQGPAPESHPHAPMMAYQHPLDPTTTIAPEPRTDSDKTEEEDIEFQDEEPEALQEAKQKVVGVPEGEEAEGESTEDTLNAETDEAVFAAENRLKGRRGEEKRNERHSIGRSLYPFIINRLLG